MRYTVLIPAVALILAAGAGFAYLAWDPFPEEVGPTFKDVVSTNVTPTADQFDLAFIDSSGEPVRLADYVGRKHVMLIFMRGYAGSICPYCSAQTSRLIGNHAEFVRRDTEILLVFPGPKEHLEKLISAGRAQANGAEVPFRILLDPDFAAVDKLGIRGSLAKPSTYLLDKQGRLRFAYVGAYTGDRPSIKAMLDQLDRAVAAGGTP